MDDVASMARSADKDVQRAMETGDGIIEEEDRRAGAAFEKGKQENVTFTQHRLEKGKRSRLDG